MAKLEVIISADSSELNAEIVAAEKKIKDLAKTKISNIKLGIDNTSLNRDIATAKKDLTGLRTAVKDVGQSFDAMKKPIANGGNTLMQFSRIAQDAPFGIMGIGNNITATAESFSYLSASSGGAGNALKAVANSMMGTGGILLAVSLVTSGLTYMSQNGITVGDVFSKLTGDFDAFGNAMTKVYEEAKKSAAEQIVTTKGLIAIAQDETKSKRERLDVVDMLQKQWPKFYGQLTAEKIMYGDLTAVTKELTQALVNKAIAEKTAEKTADATVALWKANGKLIKGKEELAKAEKIYNDAAKDPEKIQSMLFYAKNVDNASERVKSAREEVLKFNKEVQRGQDIIDLASKRGSKVIAPPVTVKSKATPKAVTQVPRDQQPIDNSISLVGLAVLSNTGAQIKTTMGEIRQAVSSETVAMTELLYNFNNEASMIISESIANTFANLGSAIGSALATGGNVLKAAGNVLLSSLGGILTDLGKMAIQVGVGLLGIKAALKTLNPYVAIAAGVALVALGGFVSSTTSNMGNAIGSGSGGGSSVSTGGSYSSPSGGGYASSNNSGGGSVVFEISGQSLIGVLSNTLDKNTRLGGSLSLSN